MQIAISGLNPDPKETIAQVRERRAGQQQAAVDLVAATKGLVDATRRLVVVTWVLAGVGAGAVAVQVALWWLTRKAGG